MEQIPEIGRLLSAIEKKYGSGVNTSGDFERLQFALDNKIGATTLKRLWGYIPDRTTPRLYTLDVLAQYAGFANFKEFCDSLHASYSSEYINDGGCITTTGLNHGDRLAIGWTPDRKIVISYLGDDRWQVESSESSKLKAGDIFEASCFLKGWPLFVPCVHRGDTVTPPYIAGKAHGLSLLEKLG